ncbi:hypothetical protein GC167_03985 [bacterium]|nr:hypothetical protein [bacterium]
MSAAGSPAPKDPPKHDLRTVFWTGVVAVSPLLVLGYVLIHALRALGAALTPLAERLGVMRVIGEIGLFAALVSCLIVLFLLGGWWVLRRGQSQLMTMAERLAIKAVPGLAELKKRKDRVLLHADESETRIPGLIGIQGVWRPGWKVKNHGNWVVVAFPLIGQSEPASIEIHPKDSIQFKALEAKVFEEALDGTGSAWLEVME